MKSKRWVITDTHFNHQKLINEGHRPDDYQRQIFLNWKRLVQSSDTIIHLGDVILGQDSELPEILDDLPGYKILVRGNHDGHPDAWYLRAGFQFVVHGLLLGGVWLTHAPQATLPDGALVNVHGHLHAGTHRSTDVAAHCKLLTLEENGYTPVDLDEFVGFTSMTRRIMMPYEIEE